MGEILWQHPTRFKERLARREKRAELENYFNYGRYDCAKDAADAMTYAVLRLEQSPSRFEIRRVIFSYPATIVFWADGSKTVSRCGLHDSYDREKGVMACIAKRAYGSGTKMHAVLEKAVR